MSDENRSERPKNTAERALESIVEEGGVREAIDSDGIAAGIPNQVDHTQLQRVSEVGKWLGGTMAAWAFSNHKARQRSSLLKDLRASIEVSNHEVRAQYAAVHEAMAWALDAERYLGSFHGDERRGLPLQDVDVVADHILSWLAYRGFEVVPMRSNEADDADEELDDEDLTEDDEDTIVYETPFEYEKLSRADLDDRLGPNRVPCLKCDGEGQVDGMGPVSWSCDRCLGSGRMPVFDLEEAIDELRQLHRRSSDGWDGRYVWSNETLSGTDFSDVPLSLGSFYRCDFSRAKFNNADLSDTEFENCNLAASNPDAAASLDQAVFRAPLGLTDEQIASIVEKGGTVER